MKNDISNHSHELINSLEKKNELELKSLENYKNKVESKDPIKKFFSDDIINRIGATMPYTRYDTEEASLGGGAYIVKSPNYDEYNIASQGSNQSYIRHKTSKFWSIC